MSGALLLQAQLSVLRGFGPGVKSSLSHTVKRPRRTAKVTWLWTRKSAKKPEESRPSSPFVGGLRFQPPGKSGDSARSSIRKVVLPQEAAAEISPVKCQVFGCSEQVQASSEKALSATRPCKVSQSVGAPTRWGGRYSRPRGG